MQKFFAMVTSIGYNNIAGNSRHVEQRIGATTKKMVRKSQTEIVPMHATPVVITNESFKDVEGYVALEVREQDQIVNRHRSIIKNYAAAGKIMQTVAEELFEQRQVMKKTRTWEAYMDTRVIPDTGMSRPSILRALQRVDAEKKLQLAPAITQELRSIDKPINLKKIRVVAAPPKNPTPAQAREYAIELTSPARRSAEVATNRVDTNGQDVRFAAFIRDGRKLYMEKHGKAKQEFIKEVCGYLLTIGGIQSAQTIEPRAIPERLVYEKLKPRGRPRLEKQA
jgi:hypothetical protein